MSENILEVRNVVKNYANHTALSEVSLSVPKGVIYGLLGPNGAGKTSLIRIVNQITAPDAGDILFDGKPLNEHNIYEIGYLPEERGLYKKMKIKFLTKKNIFFIEHCFIFKSCCLLKISFGMCDRTLLD